MLGVIEERPGVSLTEIAQVTGIAKPLILSATPCGRQRGEQRVALSGGQQGFTIAQASEATTSAT